ncbi:MAG TPA: hypothetical protein PKH75_03660 [Bacillota bacterium]|nr:hypothetical protein [Bacillota bacterium]
MRKIDWLRWLPAFLCLLVVICVVGITPTVYVMIPAAAALALSLWGTVAANFKPFGWSSACVLTACALSLMEKRPVAWFEPALMGLGVICFLGAAQINSVYQRKDVSPDLMEGFEDKAACLEENDAQAEQPLIDSAPAVRSALAIGAQRAVAIVFAAMAFSYMFFALAGVRAKQLEEGFFMMMLGTTVIGVSIYWLIRLAAPDAYKKPYR